MGTGKCTGRRPPPCGRGSNCSGFEKGFRCGGHAPVGGCAGYGKVHATQEKKMHLGIPLEQWDPLTQFLVREGGR